MRWNLASICSAHGGKRNLRSVVAKSPSHKGEGQVATKESSGQGGAVVKCHSEERQNWPCAGVSVGETDAPTESASTSRDGCAGGGVHAIKAVAPDASPC